MSWRRFWQAGRYLVDQGGRAWDEQDLAARDARVADMLEEMAPALLRINTSAAETAARIMIRLRS